MSTPPDQCWNRQCPNVTQSHHHLHIGPSDSDVHDGPGRFCDDSRCAAIYTGQADDVAEPLNTIQEDLIKKVTEISEWWVKTAQSDAERTVPKAVEYGAVDFDLMGMYMVALVRDKFEGADDAELMAVGREMAVAFYLIGKMGRMVGAYQQGVMPSDDTIFDTGIYAMMMRRIRETGRWV